MTAPAVKGHGQPGPSKAGLLILPKAKLIAMILEQREDTRIQLEEKDRQITELSEQLAKLQGEIDKEKAGQKIKDINKHVNQPTSKKPEWDIVHGCTGASMHNERSAYYWPDKTRGGVPAWRTYSARYAPSLTPFPNTVPS